jgi:16S rRNA processing protein RimM
MKALPLMDMFYVLAPENEVSVNLPSGFTEPMKLKSLKRHNRYALLSFYGVNDPESASKYRGATISADKSLLPALQNEEYFYEQIIGLAVYATDGISIGKVTDIFETGSNDVYVVTGANREYLIPAIRDVIREINLEEEKIIIQRVEGLLE